MRSTWMRRVVAMCVALLGQSAVQAQVPADLPVERMDANSRLAHEQLVEKSKQGRIDVYFIGDSITRRWGATDYPQFLEHWKQTFHGWNAANFAWGGDSTQNILWRMKNGEMEGLSPKVVVIQAGTNNLGAREADEAKIADVTRGVQAIVREARERAPGAVMVLVGIFPRNDNMAVMPAIEKINANLEQWAKGEGVRWLNINGLLADERGVLREGMATRDKLHLDIAGYRVWGEALKPVLTEVLGEPGEEDLAPPATGDPSARR